MRHIDVLRAQAEAERFLRMASEYHAAHHELAVKETTAYPEALDSTPMVERAALRRASLDLTRALAKMRRS